MRLSWKNVLPLLFLLGACERGLDVNVDLRAPCDQPEWLRDVNEVRVSIDGDTLPLMHQSFIAGSGASLSLSGLPLSSNVRFNVETSGKSATAQNQGMFFASSLPVDFNRLKGSLELPLVLGRSGFLTKATGQAGKCAILGGEKALSRHGHTMTYLPRLKKILIVGGGRFDVGDQREKLLDQVELFDPMTGASKALPALKNTRAYHTATLLPDGRILLVGGFSEVEGRADVLRVAAILDLNRAEPVYVEDIQIKPRAFHTATLVSDTLPVVIIAGGCASGCSINGNLSDERGVDLTEAGRTVELFDARTRSVWEIPQALKNGRAFHSATRISKDRVVFLGGANTKGLVRGVEIYNHATRSFGRPEVGGELPFGVAKHAQANLVDDSILLSGGYSAVQEGKGLTQPNATVVKWNESDGAKILDVQMTTTRAEHLMFPLRDGRVFAIGGVVAQGGAVAEYICLSQGCDKTPVQTQATQARVAMAGVQLPNHTVLVSGGYGVENEKRLSSDEIYALADR